MDEDRAPYNFANLIEDFTDWRTHASLMSIVAFGYLIWWFIAPDCSSGWRHPYGYSCGEVAGAMRFAPFMFIYSFVVVAFIGRFLQATYNSFFSKSDEIQVKSSGIQFFNITEGIKKFTHLNDEEVRSEYFRIADIEAKSDQEIQDWMALKNIMEDRGLF